MNKLPGIPASARDGRQVVVRPVHVEDADHVQSFVRALSPQSRRNRFLSSLTQLPPYLLERLIRPVCPQEFGLLALAGASGEVVGMAQYALEAPSRAELAVVVADGWQRQGLATLFVRMLGDHAARSGIRTLCAVMFAENKAVLALMRRLGWAARGAPEPGLVQDQKPLERSEPPSCSNRVAMPLAACPARA